MAGSRLFPALCLAVLVVVPALAQAPKPSDKPPSLTARIEALEKDNQALRDDVNRLQALLTQTRRDMITMSGARIGGGFVALPAPSLPPQSLAEQSAQAQAQINQMNTQTQLNSLQLQQSMAQDRLREQQALPPPFGMAVTP